jgi:cyclopropane fatty-acyl-phospholipid synthase-like methyltransferase
MNIEEQKKYEALYVGDKYRNKYKPGINFINQNKLNINNKSVALKSLIEFGSGEGHVIKYFRDKGVDCYGTDIAGNSLSFPELDEYRYIMDLGELQDFDKEFEFIFSCDVFEHLPTESIDNLLENMKRAAPKGRAVVRIALYLDARGQHDITKALHLTVKPSTWWLDKFKEHSIEVLEHNLSDGKDMIGNLDVYLQL